MLENNENQSTSLDILRAQMTEEKNELEIFFKAEAETNQAALLTMTQDNY